MTLDKEYKEHQVFGQLSKYAEFYKDLSFSILSFGSQGVRTFPNIDTYVFSSVQGTLESIKAILLQGRINDAYALLRKYYDSAIINIYSNLYLDDHFSLENFVVEKIDNWVQGKEKLPEYRVMSNYIRSSNKLATINDLLYRDNRYKDLRDRCNNHTHYNFYYYVLLNDNEVYLKDRVAILNRFSKDLESIFILHLSYLFYLNDHYMMASDYIDSLDCGQIPEEGSQYYVAPFVQEIFDSVIKKSRMDLVVEIKRKTLMKLE
jgi:hypothetical protein